MVAKSPKINLNTAGRIDLVNPENLELLKKYNVDMTIRELSKSTIEAYNYSLKQWFVYILLFQDNRSVLSIIDEDITVFLYWCKNYGNNTNRMRFRCSSIAAFYKFLRKKKYLIANPTEFIEPPRKTNLVTVQTFLTPAEIALMREKLITNGDLQLRLYAMLSLSTMARLSAIASLRWRQIDIEHCVIHNVLEKEGKVVELYFNDEVKQLLLQLKEMREIRENIAINNPHRRKKDYGWLFYTGRCTPERHISSSTLFTWCKKIGYMIDVPTLHPHDLRHSAATMLRNAGMPLEDISVLLNHESTDTTKKFYIKEDKERINAAKNRYGY